MQTATLIVPAYNEVGRLDPEEFRRILAEDSHLNLCFVNDGSQDATRQLLSGLVDGSNGRVLLLNLERNQGKAEAVRRGVLHAAKVWPKCEWFGYWDADFAVPRDQLLLFRRAMEETRIRAKLLMGCRVKRLGARIVRRPIRHVCGRIFATAASFMLNLPVYDSQCGAKFIKSDIVNPLFKEPFATRWLVDVELLARIVAIYGHGAAIDWCLEIPLTKWLERGGSKITATDLIKIPFELLKIRKKYLIS